jgi:hypothetical protein
LAGTSADTDLDEAVLARAVSAYHAALGSRLIAGYALGSLAHGGFSALVSDVDLGLILHDPVTVKDRMTIRAVARSVKADGSALDQRLSVFWGTPATLGGQRRGGRFPPLDRLDLLEYGRLLTGQDLRSVAGRPDHTELLVAGAEFAAAAHFTGRVYPRNAKAASGDPPVRRHKTTISTTAGLLHELALDMCMGPDAYSQQADHLADLRSSSDVDRLLRPGLGSASP